MLINTLYFVFACSLMAQRKDLIIPDDPNGKGTTSLNKGLQT